jgi:hypothetical protein
VSLVSNYPDNFSSSAFALRWEEPSLTTDQIVAISEFRRIEGMRLRLQAAIEAASPTVADHYNAVAFAIDGRSLTDSEIEDAARA